MAETMAEQLAAAHAQIERLSATLEERDHTISQLQRENQALSETVAALQAQTLREQEAALNSTVRVHAGESQPTQRRPLASASQTGSSAGHVRSGVGGKQAHC
jgi:chromosome segregation ATPase